MKRGRLTEVATKKQDVGKVARPKILYVEDNETNWDITALELRSDYALEWARDSRTVFQKLAEKSFDLILMDIELAGSDLDGVEITRCLRGEKNGDLPDYAKNAVAIETPILFLTAYTARYDKSELVAMGADGVLTKPVNFHQMHQTMVGVIQAHRLRAQQALEQIQETRRDADELLQAEVSRRRKLESTLEALELRLCETREKLDFSQEQLVHAEQLATFGSMIAAIAHEFSSPASALQFALGRLNEKNETIAQGVLALFDDSKEAREVKVHFQALMRDSAEAMEIMDASVERIVEYCAALQSNARFDTSVISGVDLNDVITQSLLIVRAKTRPYELEFEPGWLELVTCKRNHIGQVVINLVGNAADAMLDHPRISGGDVPGRIRISALNHELAEQPGILVAVEDNGRGVAPPIRKKIFQNYFTTKSRGSGTGLGLAICQQIITNHGGGIWVEDSSDLGGANFSFWIPLDG